IINNKEWEKAADLISGIGPREIIIQRDNEEDMRALDEIANRHEALITPYEVWAFEYHTAYQTLLDHFNIHSLEGFGCQDMPYGIRAAGALLGYLNQTQKTSLRHITSIKPYQTESSMMLDIST